VHGYLRCFSPTYATELRAQTARLIPILELVVGAKKGRERCAHGSRTGGLIQKWYHCITCNRDYLATDRDSIAALPVTLHEYFEIVITHRCAYEKSFSEHIVRQIVMGQSAEDAARAVMEVCQTYCPVLLSACDSFSCGIKIALRRASVVKLHRRHFAPQQVPGQLLKVKNDCLCFPEHMMHVPSPPCSYCALARRRIGTVGPLKLKLIKGFGERRRRRRRRRSAHVNSEGSTND
jgi:hypothetical protein